MKTTGCPASTSGKDAEGQNYETLAIGSTLALASAVFAAAIAEKPAGS